MKKNTRLKAMNDPFAFLSTLRSDTKKDNFNVDSMGKSAHSMIGASFEEEEVNIANTIREVVDSKILVPRDMKVDDSGIPVAANLYEWVTQERFSMINGERPYIEQLVWGVIAYNEFCARCSDLEYLFHDHKPDDSYAKFSRKVSMLEHGVCPNCGWGRSKLVSNKLSKFIQELAVSAGQRSGKSLSIAGYFAPYLTHRLLKLQNPNAFYGLKTGTMLHGTFVALTYAQAKDTLWQNYYATLTESQWFCLAEGTLVSTEVSKVPIENLTVGTRVRTLGGSQPVTAVVFTGIKECFTITTANNRVLTLTADHKIRVYEHNGVAWKTCGDLKVGDVVVVDKGQRNLYDVDYGYVNVDEVTNKFPVGPKRVWDITVDKAHNFYAEGINVHNCEYHSMLNYYGEKYGEKLLKFNDTYVAYPSRGIICYPAGPDKRVLRGRTRFFYSVDEVGWFDSNKDSNKVKDNAHEVVGALDRSLLTVRGAAERLLRNGYDDVYPGYGMNVSSPSHRNDMIMTLVRRAELSDTMYGVIRPTWEVNPNLPRDSNTIVEAYRTDPINAERDYGAMPPLSSAPFLGNHAEIAACSVIKRNGIKLRRRVVHKKKRGESHTYADVVKLRKGKVATVMAIDAGLTNNSFSGVVGTIESGEVKVFLVFDIIPELGAPLNHTQIFNDVIIPILEDWHVCVLYADRWNSIKLLQDAKELVPTLEKSAQHSLKYSEIYTVKTLIQQGQLKLPKMESKNLTECLEFDGDSYPACFDGRPMDHLYLQLATVKDNGKKIDKGDGYTDDTFRSLALLVWALHEEETQIILNMTDDSGFSESVRPAAIAASKLYSGGGGTIGTMGASGPAITLGVSTSRR